VGITRVGGLLLSDLAQTARGWAEGTRHVGGVRAAMTTLTPPIQDRSLTSRSGADTIPGRHQVTP
jgi:hypothetical protein